MLASDEICDGIGYPVELVLGSQQVVLDFPKRTVREAISDEKFRYGFAIPPELVRTVLRDNEPDYPEFIKGQFATPACGSGNQDYMIANVILMPVFTIIDGYRRGLRRPWLFFLSSFFTSFAFPFAFYFATIERQRRHAQSSSAATTIDA